MVEQLTLNQLVEGSSPSRGTIFSCVSMRKKPFGGVGFYWGVNLDMVQYFTQTPGGDFLRWKGGKLVSQLNEKMTGKIL